MLSLLQYINFYFNINIATFVDFEIAVYAYVVLRTFTYSCTQGQVARVNAYRASCYISICFSTLPTQHTTSIYNNSSNTIDDGECSSFFGNSTECCESNTNVYCAIEFVSFPGDEFVERNRNFLVYCGVEFRY